MDFPSVYCLVEENEGEGDFGGHHFAQVPRRGDVIELWLDPEHELIARVEEVRMMEMDPETGNADITLFVKIL